MAQFEAKEIGARIGQARREAGLTQEQLAEMAPFSYRSLQDYERGLTIPYRQLRDISKLLGRPVEWFLRGDIGEEPSVLARLDEVLERMGELERRLDVLISSASVPEGLAAEARAEAARALEQEAELARLRTREASARRDRQSA
jgi:transcriptional regulator with XRE-family HTH domain